MAALKISQASHDKLIKLAQAIQDQQRDFTEFRDKLTSIDIAYAKHTITLAKECDTDPDLTALKVPVVNSEIDSVAGYLSQVFLSRSPLFPVVSDGDNYQEAMALQAIIERDARYQRYGRQILKFIKLAARYNVAAIEVDNVYAQDVSIQTSTNLDPEVLLSSKPVSKLYTPDMYNLLYDYRIAPADIPFEGEYIGYNKLVTRAHFKTLASAWSKAEQAYNLNKAFQSTMADITSYWNNHPDVSDIIPVDPVNAVDWFDWAGIVDTDSVRLSDSAYFLTRLYVKLIPREFGLGASKDPKIIKLTIANMQYVVSYQEVVTPLDTLPILLCDLREDGFDFQTKSVGENVQPFQDIATELLSARLEGSKRALADRAIYDAMYLDRKDVNNPSSTAKIPLKAKLRSSGDRPALNQLYYPIPFEAQGLVSAMADLQTVLQIKDDVNGSNAAFRGQQTPGNRTLGEVDNNINRSESKAMPYALMLEEQVFTPMKLILKLNIMRLQNLEDKVLDINANKSLPIDITKLRKAMTEFKIADGLKPKSALRDPTVLSTAIQFIQNSEELNATYNTSDIFADMMQVLDIDVSKHKREVQPNGNPGGAAAPNAQPGATDPNAPGAGGQDTQ